MIKKINTIKNVDLINLRMTGWCFTLMYMEPFRTLRNWYHDMCNLLFRRYDLIRTGLSKKDWHDKDVVMLYGMMNLLVDYVEKEKCFEVNSWDEDDDAKRAKKEIKEIYKWWQAYDKRLETISKSKRPTQLKILLEAEEQDMLIRLVKIRNYLWT